MTTEIVNKIRAEFIAESMKQGFSFEESVDKSFDQVNDFLMSLMNNESFNESVFNKVKEIVK